MKKKKTGRPRKVFTQDQKERIHWWYDKTSCSIERIASHFDCSPLLISRELDKAIEPQDSDEALNFDRPKIFDFSGEMEPTRQEVDHIENTDGITLHDAQVAYGDDETGERWVLCWVRVEGV